jgi:hypothetical protein
MHTASAGLSEDDLRIGDRGVDLLPVLERGVNAAGRREPVVDLFNQDECASWMRRS